MRVISGRAKGRRLHMVPGEKTRPMMDRIKENLFNLLGPHFVPESRWLDLFAGTGQVGIEALSRGASEVVFVDTARAAVRTVHGNLKRTELADDARVLHTDAFAYLRSGVSAPFDVVFVAPPQYHGIWKEVLAVIDEQPARYLTPRGFVIVQIDPREYEEQTLQGLQVYDLREYGNTALCFYELILPEAVSDESVEEEDTV
ncbi:MAG TPA: 16S rRNA (guanine(966)-N(2))-methyltransferase RsmD [Candidatus Sulfomarinibacteraceae bacterium]|nr:16S rRNA (guanine(966)-N(2))-methyltransferase RsmD [Candidatus Sulfomarinibacteraceae bacterium]